MMDKKIFILAGIAIALIIASYGTLYRLGNPDGLGGCLLRDFRSKGSRGSTLDEEMAGTAEEEVTAICRQPDAPSSHHSPITVSKDSRSLIEAAAVIIGTLVVVGIAFGLSRVVARKG